MNMLHQSLGKSGWSFSLRGALQKLVQDYQSWDDLQKVMCLLFLTFIVVYIAYSLVKLMITITAPKSTQKARIEKKYMNVTTHYQNGMQTGRTETPYVVFRMEDGSSRKFRVSKRDYNRFIAGESGVLFYKGYHFSDFHVL